MANNSLVTVSTLAKNNEKIKEQLATKVNIEQGTENVNKILAVGEDGNLKLTDIPDGGEGNKIDSISVNGVNVEIDTNKNVDITVPDTTDFITKAVSDLENYYLKTETYTQTEVNDLLSAIATLKIEVVNTLPTPTDKLLNKVYLLLSDDHFYKCVNVSGTYKFKDITPLSSGEGITVYDDYKSLPTKLDREIICYVKNDYKDTINNTTYKKGFYLYDTTTSKWELISSQNESALSDYTETITISSKSWYIQHNLNTEWWKLQINIIDDEGNIVYGDVDLDKTTNNLLVLVFDTAIQGKIYIKK